MVERAVFSFIREMYDPSRPVLLALSGGPDSLAMLYLLELFREDHPLDVAIAHIDHGWREESAQEAEQLRQLALTLKHPFHLKTLQPDQLEGNLEAACRQERLQFYAELCQTHGYQAVILGHHADDQAETVLKRILEGAKLSHLGAMQEVSTFENISLWRPLLHFTKKEIQYCFFQYFPLESTKAIIDKTNLDSRFLRGRFRTEILPDLAKSFGKEVSGNLCHLAIEASELQEFLSMHLEKQISNILEGPMGTFLDLSNTMLSLYEIKYLISEICRRNELLVSRDALDDICFIILEGKSNRKFNVGSRQFFLDRGRLFLIKDQKREWKVEMQELQQPKAMVSGLQNIWKGSVEISLPKGNYHIGPGCNYAPYPGGTASLDKWWTNGKVPAFLRQVPVIWQKDRICHEFQTGRKAELAESSKSKNWIQITLTLKE